MNKNYGVLLMLFFVSITWPGFGVDGQEEQKSKPKTTHELDKKMKKRLKIYTEAQKYKVLLDYRCNKKAGIFRLFLDHKN